MITNARSMHLLYLRPCRWIEKKKKGSWVLHTVEIRLAIIIIRQRWIAHRIRFEVYEFNIYQICQVWPGRLTSPAIDFTSPTSYLMLSSSAPAVQSLSSCRVQLRGYTFLQRIMHSCIYILHSTKDKRKTQLINMNVGQSPPIIIHLPKCKLHKSI